jgi:hypothetical protein
MAEAEGIPPTASVASVGPRINYLGQHIYAYSGEIIVTNATVTCLEFTTGAGYIMADFIQSIDMSQIDQGQLIGFSIELNGVVVCKFEEHIRSIASTEYIGLQKYEFLIPPFTLVTTKAYTDDSSNNPFFHTMSGRVYDA